jgi:hypothetical protein
MSRLTGMPKRTGPAEGGLRTGARRRVGRRGEGEVRLAGQVRALREPADMRHPQRNGQHGELRRRIGNARQPGDRELLALLLDLGCIDAVEEQLVALQHQGCGAQGGAGREQETQQPQVAQLDGARQLERKGLVAQAGAGLQQHLPPQRQRQLGRAALVAQGRQAGRIEHGLGPQPLVLEVLQHRPGIAAGDEDRRKGLELAGGHGRPFWAAAASAAMGTGAEGRQAPAQGSPAQRSSERPARRPSRPVRSP